MDKFKASLEEEKKKAKGDWSKAVNSLSKAYDRLLERVASSSCACLKGKSYGSKT